MNEEIDHTSENLIAYLRDQLNDPMIGYESPLTQLQGGFATRIYRFQLKGAQKEFAEPLVLRLYPEYYDTESEPAQALPGHCGVSRRPHTPERTRRSPLPPWTPKNRFRKSG